MMNQGWCCTSKVIAQIMIVFTVSIYDSDAIILYDNMPASAMDKVVTFAGEVLFGGKSRLQPNWSRLVATELTCAYQANMKNLLL